MKKLRTSYLLWRRGSEAGESVEASLEIRIHLLVHEERTLQRFRPEDPAHRGENLEEVELEVPVPALAERAEVRKIPGQILALEKLAEVEG